jgi:hypothetical protein
MDFSISAKFYIVWYRVRLRYVLEYFIYHVERGKKLFQDK